MKKSGRAADQPMRMRTNRAKYMERGGVDPLHFDKRPLTEFLNDEIPYTRWKRELKDLKRKGYFSWRHYLRMRKFRCTSS